VTLPVTLRVEARQDFDAAFDWYEAQRPGLGAQFAERVQYVLDGISSRPALYPRVLGDVRRGVVRQFPYLFIYQAEPERIVVLAILHGSRDPDLWRERL
jgi:plasmid stabilization system protein ParE